MFEHLKICGYSTALFSTWIYIEEMRLLLDAGDGVSAALMQKSRKIDTITISHPDRDHVAGLLQFRQLNARDGNPTILYPKDCSSFPALADFCRLFDPHAGEPTWIAVQPGEEHRMPNKLKIRVIPSNHIERPGLVKSVGYQVVLETQKLKPEYCDRTQQQLEELSRSAGASALTQTYEEVILGYSGDTGVTTAAQWTGCRNLIHESTFLHHDDAGNRTDRNQHSVLGDVLLMARDVRPATLVLNHFSSRYKPAAVQDAVFVGAQALALPFPIFVIPPGEIVRDLFATKPAWPGAA